MSGHDETETLGSASLAFLRVLPSALAHRRNFVALAEAVVAILAGTFDGVCGYYSARGPYEGQVFLSPVDCGGYSDTVVSIYATATQAMGDVHDADLSEVQGGLPFVVKPDGKTATFMWLGEARAGAFVIERSPAPFDSALLEQAATSCAVAAEVIAVGADISQLEAETRHDFLTGLLNRSFFEQALPAEIGRASRVGSDFSLVFMDLDGFKRFNDSFGHRRGDEFLAEVGVALDETLRRADTATRYGGDEFGLILPNTAPDQAVSTLARLRDRIESISAKLGTDAIVGASFGLAHFPSDAKTSEELIGVADSRLYHSKQQVRAVHQYPAWPQREPQILPADEADGTGGDQPRPSA